MAIKDEILLLRPSIDHLWTHDGVHDDYGTYSQNIPTNDTNAEVTFVSKSINRGTSQCVNIGEFGRLRANESSATTKADVNNRTFFAWFNPPANCLFTNCFYSEGGKNSNFIILSQLGNSLSTQIRSIVSGKEVEMTISSQKAFEVNVPFMVAVVYNGTTDTYDLYHDITLANIKSIQIPSTSGVWARHRSDMSFGTIIISSMQVGDGLALRSTLRNILNLNVGIAGSERASYSQTEINQIFGLTAPYLHLITSQADLDTLAGQNLGNYPVCIRIETDDDIDFVANGINFSEEASVHLLMAGTGNCTWNNANGSNALPSKVIAPFGGSIQIINPNTFTITDLQIGSDVIIKNPSIFPDGNDNNVIYRISDISTSIAIWDFLSAPSTVDIEIFKTGYKMRAIRGVSTTNSQTIIATQQTDTAYNN